MPPRSQILLLAILIFSCLTAADATECAQCLPDKKWRICHMKTCTINHNGVCTATFIYKGNKVVDRILGCHLKKEVRCELNQYYAIGNHRFDVKCCSNHNLCNMDFVVTKGK